MLTIKELLADYQRIVNECKTTEELLNIKKKINCYFPHLMDEMTAKKTKEIEAMAAIKSGSAKKGHEKS